MESRCQRRGLHSCIRTSESNRVVYNDRFSLVSVNVRVKLQWLQWERSENQQPIHGPRMLSLAVSGVIEHIELDKGLDMVDKSKCWITKMNKSEMT